MCAVYLYPSRTSSLHSIVSRRLREDRKLKEDQDKEYQKALEIDMLKVNLTHCVALVVPQITVRI